jgi:hypothetical protein
MFKKVEYDKHFVIGTPLVGWKCDKGEHLSWLDHAEDIIKRFPNAKFFSAFELDSRGIDPFIQVVDKLNNLGGSYWTYGINDFETNVTSENRWIRIETGRNLIREFAQRKRIITGHHWGEDSSKENYGIVNYDAILYVDSDMILTPGAIKKMFEVDRPLVGIDVPAYSLHGKLINKLPKIEEHWNTAGMLLVNAPAYYDLVWGSNRYLNLSDDPSFQWRSERLEYGQTWVRKDIFAMHKGELLKVENRRIPPRNING